MEGMHHKSLDAAAAARAEANKKAALERALERQQAAVREAAAAAAAAHVAMQQQQQLEEEEEQQQQLELRDVAPGNSGKLFAVLAGRHGVGLYTDWDATGVTGYSGPVYKTYLIKPGGPGGGLSVAASRSSSASLNEARMGWWMGLR